MVSEKADGIGPERSGVVVLVLPPANVSLDTWIHSSIRV